MDFTLVTIFEKQTKPASRETASLITGRYYWWLSLPSISQWIYDHSWCTGGDSDQFKGFACWLNGSARRKLLKSRSTGEKWVHHYVATHIVCLSVICALLLDHETKSERLSETEHNVHVGYGIKRHQ